MAEQVKSKGFEESCAIGYTYLATNAITDELKKEQIEAAKKAFNLETDQVPNCDCVPKDGKCCFNSTCKNRSFKFGKKNADFESVILACPESCATECCNNPFDKTGFAVDKDKLEKKEVADKGYGLFAVETISKGEHVGEYRGEILRGQLINDEDRNSYAFKIPMAGHIIDAYKQGSAMRFVNNSCEPNCAAVFFFHNGQFKLVFVALKKISPGTEVTVNYGWEFFKEEINPPCFCGSLDCTDTIGIERPEFYGPPFQMPSLSSSNQKITEEKFDPAFTETHSFTRKSIVYAVNFSVNNLSVQKCEVTEVRRNTKGFYFYEVRDVKYAHVAARLAPMFSVFKFKENAETFLSTITENDLKSLTDFLNAGRTFKLLQTTSTEIVPDYVKRLRAKLLERKEEKVIMDQEEKVVVQEQEEKTKVDEDQEDLEKTKNEGKGEEQCDSDSDKASNVILEGTEEELTDDDEIEEIEKVVPPPLYDLTSDGEQNNEILEDAAGFKDAFENSDDEVQVLNDDDEEEQKPSGNEEEEKQQDFGGNEEEEEQQPSGDEVEQEQQDFGGDEEENEEQNFGDDEEEEQQQDFEENEQEEEQQNSDKEEEKQDEEEERQPSGDEQEEEQDEQENQQTLGIDEGNGEQDEANEECSSDEDNVVFDKALLKVIQDTTNSAMLRRLLNQAAETVAQFLINRLKKSENQFLDFDQAFGIVYPVLESFYLNKIPKERRFLLFEDYRVATETAASGSLNWRWCGLCKLEKGFLNYENFVNHFFDHHAICHSIFKCSEEACEFETGYLDKFLNHVSENHAELQVGHVDVEEKIRPYLYKSFADFVALRKSSLFLIRAGIPTAKGTKKIVTEVSGEIEINLETNKAFNVDLKPSLFVPQVISRQVFKVDGSLGSKKNKMKYKEPRTKNFGTANNCTFVTNKSVPPPGKGKPAIRNAANQKTPTSQEPGTSEVQYLGTWFGNRKRKTPPNIAPKPANVKRRRRNATVKPSSDSE